MKHLIVISVNLLEVSLLGKKQLKSLGSTEVAIDLGEELAPGVRLLTSLAAEFRDLKEKLEKGEWREDKKVTGGDGGGDAGGGGESAVPEPETAGEPITTGEGEPAVGGDLPVGAAEAAGEPEVTEGQEVGQPRLTLVK